MAKNQICEVAVKGEVRNPDLLRTRISRLELARALPLERRAEFLTAVMLQESA